MLPADSTPAFQPFARATVLGMPGRKVTRQGELALLLYDTGWRPVEQYSASDFPMAPTQLLIART